MNEQDLLLIKYLHQFNNITKTANALFISQPALSARIKRIEKDLDTKLICSNNKGVYLTPAGLEVAEFADGALKRLEALKERVNIIDNKNCRIIKLTAPNIISQYYLPSVIKKFKQLQPQTLFEITVAPSSKVVTLMNEKRCHFGFLRNDFGWEHDKQILLCVNYIAAVSLHYFEMKDLDHMSRVDYTTDTYYKKMLDLWWNNTFSTLPKVDVMVNSLDLCKEMVFSGLGFGLLPSVFLPECPEACSYILRDREGKKIERNTFLIYRDDIVENKLDMEFLYFIKKSDFSQFLQIKLRQ